LRARLTSGGRVNESKLFLGQFGPVEMPFVVRHVASGWRVEVEPYFALMLQQLAIVTSDAEIR
jgi:hypothetical protein